MKLAEGFMRAQRQRHHNRVTDRRPAAAESATAAPTRAVGPGKRAKPNVIPNPRATPSPGTRARPTTHRLRGEYNRSAWG